MKLKTYLAEKNIRAGAFAKTLGVAGSTVTRILSGQRRPRAELMRKINRATDGDVAPNDFYDLDKGET